MQDAEKRKQDADRREAEAEKKRLAKEAQRRTELANKQMLSAKSQDNLGENGSLQSHEIKDEQAKLPMAGSDNPDLSKQLSVRSSGRDRNAVDYNRLASGTQGDPTQFDPSQTTINKQGSIKTQKSGFQVNQKNHKKSQDLIKTIKCSQQWLAVA